MVILGRLVLPSDVAIVPVTQLPPELREQVEHEGGDYSVTRPRSRQMSSIVDASTAALLEYFREPSTIVDAVIGFSAAKGREPQETLDEATAVLSGFVKDGLLLSADSRLAQPIATSLVSGDQVSSFEIIEPVHVIVDTEVYLACASDGSAAALKIARPGAGEHLTDAFAHEASVLRHLDGRVNPRLLELGQSEGLPFLALSWCDGVNLYRATAEARQLDEPADRIALLELAARVIEAYAHLHAQQVLHGDIHPRNLLVNADGMVTIIDYGLAAKLAGPDELRARSRGGIDFFLEPEIADASLAGRPAPALTAASEQYSLGALLYLLLTGAHTHSFSLEPELMLQQLLREPPLPFDRHGVGDLPTVERVIRRALAKDPHVRYRSVVNLLRSFRTAANRDLQSRRVRSPQPRQPRPARQLLNNVLARLAVPGKLFEGGLAAPTASAMNGAAGFAYALLRIAGSRADEAMLALADLWSTQALVGVDSEEAFWSAELGIVPEIFGENSFYHHAGGVHCVQALVAHARGDERAQQIAVEAFLSTAQRPSEHLDIAFGRAGQLLGCSLLLDALPSTLDDGPLRSCGDALRDSLWSALDYQPPLTEGTQLRLLGAAHGWAGLLFAILRWSQASVVQPPAGLYERLEQLGALGQPVDRGLYWPPEVGIAVSDPALAASWCNGAAGYVYLWTLAHSQSGDERFARLARMAGWTAYDGLSAPGDLCCGFAGRAYALLCLYKHYGEVPWLARARILADHATARIALQTVRSNSLYKGEIGVALLAADLEAPDYACMPLFEGEAWP